MGNKTVVQEPVLARRKRAKLLFPYLCIAPAILLFAVFTIYPFIRTIVLSFALTDKTGNFSQWVGLANWKRVLSKDAFWDIIGVTLKMAAINLVFTFGIAMIFALLATKKVRFSKLYQTMYALPMAIASSPAAAIFLFIYRQKNGLLNNILGTEIGWLTDSSYAIWAVCGMTIWMHIGTSFIFLLVGFRNVPEDLAGRRRPAAAHPPYHHSHRLPPDLLRAVPEHQQLLQELRPDQAADPGRPVQQHQDPDLLHLRERHQPRPL